MNDLAKAGALFHQGTVTHRYGHCWRCTKPIIYRVTDQWFLKVSAIKEDLNAANARSSGTPSGRAPPARRTGSQTRRDWCISRQRYWGTPLPSGNASCGNTKVVSSLEELRSGRGYIEGMDVHRPWIDNITFNAGSARQT